MSDSWYRGQFILYFIYLTTHNFQTVIQRRNRYGLHLYRMLPKYERSICEMQKDFLNVLNPSNPIKNE